MIQLKEGLWVAPECVTAIEVRDGQVYVRVRDQGTVTISNDYGRTPHATAQRMAQAVAAARERQG